jgi:hypothetical protein
VFPVTGIVKYSDIITYAVLSTNDICLSFCHLGDWKKLQRRPLTAVSPLFLRKLRDQVRENVWQVEDAYRAKDNLCFAPSRCHSKPDSHQMLRRSSFVQKNWGSIYGICRRDEGPWSRQRRFSVVLIESTFFVEVSVQTNDFIALSDEFRR